VLTLNKYRKIKLNYDNKHTLFLFKHTYPNIKATKKINIGEVINPIIPINCMKRLSASKLKIIYPTAIKLTIIVCNKYIFFIKTIERKVTKINIITVNGTNVLNGKSVNILKNDRN
jgi:hypothetical protein